MRPRPECCGCAQVSSGLSVTTRSGRTCAAPPSLRRPAAALSSQFVTPLSQLSSKSNDRQAGEEVHPVTPVERLAGQELPAALGASAAGVVILRSRGPAGGRTTHVSGPGERSTARHSPAARVGALMPCTTWPLSPLVTSAMLDRPASLAEAPMHVMVSSSGWAVTTSTERRGWRSPGGRCRPVTTTEHGGRRRPGGRRRQCAGAVRERDGAADRRKDRTPSRTVSRRFSATPCSSWAYHRPPRGGN